MPFDVIREKPLAIWTDVPPRYFRAQGSEADCEARLPSSPDNAGGHGRVGKAALDLTR